MQNAKCKMQNAKWNPDTRFVVLHFAFCIVPRSLHGAEMSNRK